MDYTSALKNVIMEKETDGFDYRYVYGLEKLSVLISPVTTGAGGLVENGKVKLWYHHEHRLGSTDFLTDNIAGKVTSYIDYDEWGEPVKKAILKMGQRELDLVTEYTVHPYDAVLGVYYARARMLDTGDKRFMAVDPVKGAVTDPQTMVQYTYVLSNPILFIDPLGLYYIVEYDSLIPASNGAMTKEAYYEQLLNTAGAMGKELTKAEKEQLKQSVNEMYGKNPLAGQNWVRAKAYEVVPESRAKTVVKAGVDFIPIPFASTIIYAATNDYTNVVGGSSAENLDISILLDLADAALLFDEAQTLLGKIHKSTGKLVGKAVGWGGNVVTVVNIAKREVILSTDEIIFSMIERNKLPTHANNIQTLKTRMDLAYELVESNRAYFYDKTMFGGRTFFEIDMALCKSKNARGDIQKLVDEYKSQKNFDFINSDFFAKNLVEDQYYNEVNKIAVALSQHFNGYGNRLSALDDLFKEIMSLKME